MAKKNFCPRCGSKKIKWQDPQMGLWDCKIVDIVVYVIFEDGNIEKSIKNAKKMRKLTKKLSWRK